MQFVEGWLLQGKWNERWPDKQAWCMSTIWGKWGVGGMPGMWCPGAWRGMPAMPAMPPHLDWQGHPLTTRPMTRQFSAMIHSLIGMNFNQLPVVALYQILALLGCGGPSCGEPNYWPLSPAQFETNHPKTRWASGGCWRMEENTNSEIQSQDWYNQVADEKKSKAENLEIKENGTCSISPRQSKP